MTNKSIYFLFIILSSWGASAQNASYKNLWDDEKLYTNIDNEIDIAITKYPFRELEVKTDRGTLLGENGSYILRIGKAGPVDLLIYRNGTVIYSKELFVYPFPRPKLCMTSFRGKELDPEDFLGAVWVKNPLDYYSNLDVKMLNLEYLQPGNYTGNITFEGKSIRGAYKKLISYQTTEMWINSVEYFKPDSSIGKVVKPEACRCYIPRITKEKKLEKPSTIKTAIVILAYPPMMVDFGNSKSRLVSKKQLTAQRKIGLISPVQNTFGFKLISFDMNIRRLDGKIERYSSNSNRLSPQMLSALRRTSDGDQISIANAKARNHMKTMSILGINLIADDE